MLKPPLTSLRSRECFDFDWLFLKDDARGAQRPAFNDSRWRSLQLPHDWSIEGPFRVDAPGGGSHAWTPNGVARYRKRFRLAPADRDRHISIEFDGVYHNSDVWINGHHLGHRAYGYIGFAYDLTPHLTTARRMALVWGVHAVVSADAHSMGDAMTRATRVAQTEGFAEHGQEIVVAAGVPFGHSGTTNVLRVTTVR